MTMETNKQKKTARFSGGQLHFLCFMRNSYLFKFFIYYVWTRGDILVAPERKIGLTFG